MSAEEDERSLLISDLPAFQAKANRSGNTFLFANVWTWKQIEELLNRGQLNERFIMTSWRHLEKRFGSERPRKLLALDGGGIRGVLSLEILAEIEKKIAAKTGVDRLGDYFDYVAGTSTGAIIAAGLSIGMTAAELLQFYREAGVSMFEKNALLQ